VNIKIGDKGEEGKAPLLKYHVMKTYMEHVRSPHTVYFDIRWKEEALSCTSCFALVGTVLCTQLIGDWVGRRAVLDVAEERKPPFPAGIQPSVVHAEASYTLKSQRTCVKNIGTPNCGT
jgi:hypothetical protein